MRGRSAKNQSHPFEIRTSATDAEDMAAMLLACADESVFEPIYALELELFDSQLFRFSHGETTEEVSKKGKSKSDHYLQASNAIFSLKQFSPKMEFLMRILALSSVFFGRLFGLSLLTPPAAWFRHALHPGRRGPAKGTDGGATEVGTFGQTATDWFSFNEFMLSINIVSGD